MIVDRDLLWRAYPAGLLPLQGVTSLGGWTCLGTSDRSSWWGRPGEQSVRVQPPEPGELAERRRRWRPTMEIWRTAFDLGDFLPSPNQHDAATWACQLRDLGLVLDPQAKPLDISWQYTNIGLGGKWFWCISWPAQDSARGRLLHSFDVDARDPVKALVLARIHLNGDTT